jgi:hypothetical protein
VCGLKRRLVAAARLYVDAFTADPKLAEDLKAGHRYNAGCFAALAAAGQGTDADKLDGDEQSRLRQQALAWLRADLEQWSRRVEGGTLEDRQAVRATLQHWLRDTALAGVRDADALKKLTAQEQETWRKLWADVAEALKKTHQPPLNPLPPATISPMTLGEPGADSALIDRGANHGRQASG